MGLEPTQGDHFWVWDLPSLRSRLTTPLHQINGLAAMWEWGFPVDSGLRGISGIRTHALRRLAAAHPHVLLSQFGDVVGIEPTRWTTCDMHQPFSPILVLRSVTYKSPSFNPSTPYNLTTTWLFSNFVGSYHSLIVVQGCRSSSLHLGSLSSHAAAFTTVASPCLWYGTESNRRQPCSSGKCSTSWATAPSI